MWPQRSNPWTSCGHFRQQWTLLRELAQWGRPVSNFDSKHSYAKASCFVGSSQYRTSSRPGSKVFGGAVHHGASNTLSSCPVQHVHCSRRTCIYAACEAARGVITWSRTRSVWSMDGCLLLAVRGAWLLIRGYCAFASRAYGRRREGDERERLFAHNDYRRGGDGSGRRQHV